MIRFENVTKRYRLKAGVKTILENASFEIPRGRSLGVLGVNGAGKSTLLRLVSGSELPDRGRITRNGVSISWPLGFSGSFHGSLSGRDNLKFACRVYSRDVEAVTDFVQSFAELGAHLDEPVNTYSSGMKARLAFGLSMAFNFDVYLVDEITAVGDARFKAKCAAVFTNKLEKSDIIMVSHSMATLAQYCSVGCVLRDGKLEFYDSIDDAIAVYNSLMKDQP
ncbi:ABC transporter ATP-binding protein [Pinisolibacter sp.]|uniref:ABC transporter ATP-binding protein n=1 Tax=Pinisolibacter sp. TaxID=2172024 RepID=UPI002FDD7F44